VIPGPVNHQLEHLRDTSGYRINRTAGGWLAYQPGKPAVIKAATLDELAAKIMPPAGRPPLPGRD
jgi:hypothetical protein